MSASQQSLNLAEAERGMISAVVSHFLTERKPTPRRELILKYEEPELLNSLVTRTLLRYINNQGYLPTPLSFYFCGDTKAVALARESVEIVLYSLKSLFRKTDDENRFFKTEEIEAEARHLGKAIGPDTIWLGLYFAESFGVLGGWQPGANETEKVSVRVSEYILSIKQIDNIWKDRQQQQLQWLAQRDLSYPPPHLLQVEDDPDVFHPPHVSLSVFISHSSKDADLALAVIDLLKAGLGIPASQIRCSSVDGYRLPVGVNTESKLREEVNAAEVVIGLITPSSLASAFVMFELGARWGAQSFLAPLLAGVRPSELSGPLSLLNALSAEGDAQLHQLLENIATQLDVPLQSTASYLRDVAKVQALAERVFTPPAQRLIEKPPEQIRGEYQQPTYRSDVSHAMPRPYLEILDSTESMFRETAFQFTNRGGDVCHNLQVQPFTIHYRTVTFELIPVIAVSETKKTIPGIAGEGPMRHHDIIHLMVDEWNAASGNQVLSGDRELDEWSKQLAMQYEDFTGQKFEATMDFVVYPVRHILKEKHATDWPKRDDKTWEIRNVKFRRI